MKSTLNRLPLWTVGLSVVALLVVQITMADPTDPPEEAEPTIQQERTTALGGADRYLTYVSTDKPIYRPGETAYCRGVLLHHAQQTPLADDKQASATVEIRGPKGDVVAGGQVTTEESVFGFSWPIPEDQSGGEYTVKVTYPWLGYTPAERTFDIRAYRAPRLRSQIKFLRDGYGAGDEVVATLETTRAEGGIPEGAAVTAIARVDGVEAYRGSTVVDSDGHCTVRFHLPVSISRGEGTLALVIEDGGVVETASKTIPILLQTVDLTMYPEGGDLVAGLSSRIYFEAFTPSGKPADLAGVVIDADGNEVATFRSEHEGRGRLTITPEADTEYLLKITEPAGITTLYPLPTVKAEGVVLGSTQDVATAEGDIELTVAAATAGDYVVTLGQRESEIARQAVQLDAGETSTITLDPADADGVLIATVWDADGNPLAERLVFRHPAHSINIQIHADSVQYVPGGQAVITITTTDENGDPIQAVVGLTVTDDSVLEMIETREQSPRLPVMVLLENDVKELADAQVYLDPDNPDAPRAVDLLLGTQGWRRFAFVNTTEFLAEHGDAGRRVLAMQIVTQHELHRLENEGVVLALRGAVAEARAFRDAAAPPEPQAAHAEAPVDEAAPAVDQNAAEAPGPDPANEPVVVPPADLGDEIPALQPDAPESEFRAELREALEEAQVAEDADALFADGERADRRRNQRNDFAAIRIFAHEVRHDRQPGDRVDFAETLFWHAGIRTDEKGQATFAFGLSDAVTSFRVFADALGGDGALGADSIAIESVQPFYTEPKLPLEVTTGDTIRLPIAWINATGTDLPVSLDITAHEALTWDASLGTFTIGADTRMRTVLPINVGRHYGDAQFTINASAGPYADRVTRQLRIVPSGFPIEVAYGGLLHADGVAQHEFTIPETVVPGSLSTRVLIYPTPLASMSEALAALIREPCGCFEQTSSSTYPLVMAQQYFMTHQGIDPMLISQSNDILGRGYARLTGYECPSGGYEWFGADPGHEALTAYGLLEFTDMAEVYPVDAAMIARTRDWLLGQRDGEGGFKRERRALHTWIADPECSNSYILWALLSADIDADLTDEVAWVRNAGEHTDNAYVKALAANALALAGDEEGLNHLLDELGAGQNEDGSVSGATTSIVGSGGDALVIETTALAVLAWLQHPAYAHNVEQSIQYLAEACKSGRYGSTQSTVLALRAIVAYDASRAHPKASGELIVLVDGRQIGEPVPFDEETQGSIELPDFAELLAAGEHSVEVRMADGSRMPYSIAVNYHSLTPASSRDCKLYLEVSLSDEAVEEGGITEANVTIINRTDETIPTPMAIIGLPGGLEVRHDQLKELVDAGTIAAYEVRGREVILYWRSLAEEQRLDLPLSLLAAVPGSYTGPASRAYLYYTDEHKMWVDGLSVDISPRNVR